MSEPSPARRGAPPKKPVVGQVSRRRHEWVEASNGDAVESWKRQVFARVDDDRLLAGNGPRVRIRATFAFFGLAALAGARRGPIGSLEMAVLLSSVCFVQELPRALLGLALRRSALVRISATGTDTTLSGPALRGVWAVLYAVIGSVANLAFSALALVLATFVRPSVAEAFSTLACGHALWAIASLLPILPFRAGSAISARLEPSARFLHGVISCTVVVALGGVLALWLRAPVVLGIFLLVVFAGAFKVRQAFAESRDLQAGVDRFLERATAELCTDPERACELARQGLAAALSAPAQQRAWKALAWAAIGKKDPFLAHDALLHLPAEAIDAHLLASYLTTCNRVDEAVEVLTFERSHGRKSREATKLLADLTFRKGDYDAVLGLVRDDEALLTDEDRSAIRMALDARSCAG